MTISTETDKERRAEFSARRSLYRDEQPETKTLGIADGYFSLDKVHCFRRKNHRFYCLFQKNCGYDMLVNDFCFRR